MIILRILGILLLIVLVLGIGLTIFTLTAPARIELKRKLPEGKLKLRIGFGPVRRVILLGKKKPKPKPKPEQQKPEKKAKPKKAKPPKPPRYNIRKLDIRMAVSVLLTLIDDMAGAMTWEKLHVSLILHTNDHARTGELLGGLSALVGNIYPYMERAFVMEDTRIVIDADFEAEKTIWEIDISVMTRIGRFLRVLWKRKRKLWALWKSIRTTKEEREAWSRQHAAAREDNT